MITTRQLVSYFWSFIRRQKGLFLTIALLDAFAWPADVLVWPWIFQLVIDAFTQFDGHRAEAWAALQGPIWGAIVLTLFVELSSRTMGFCMGKAVPKLVADIRLSMFDHIQYHSPSYFNERFAGGLSNQITEMTTQVEKILEQFFFPLIPAAVASIAAICILGSIEPWIALILFGWIVAHLTIVFLYARRIDVAEHIHGQVRSSLVGQIVDSLTNNFAVNLFFRFRHEKKTVLSTQRQEEATNVASRWIVEWMNCYTSLGFFIGNLFLINGSLIYFWMQGTITTGQVIQVATTCWSISNILWIIGRSLPLLFQAMGSAKQAYSVLLDPCDLGDLPQALALRVDTGSIVFDNVSFQYGEKEMFRNKHVTIGGGEKVGLVGFTGAGKSTFISLILRLFPLQSGQIRIDGQSIAAVTLESLRRHIALIPQDPVLFHRSLRDNIAYGKPDATDEEIFHAAQLAHCDEFIRRLPEGYDAKVGERGTKLSGGEKQRIAIARALLVDAPILILDEATSSLDSLTERFIQDSLHTLMGHRTTLVIAHRLSTLAQLDRILVFDQGDIVEEGAHEALLKKGGLYAKMWNMQVGGFLP